MKLTGYHRHILSLLVILLMLPKLSLATPAICKLQMKKVPGPIRKIRNRWANFTMPKEFKDFDQALFDEKTLLFEKQSLDNLLSGDIKIPKNHIEEQLAYIKVMSSKVKGNKYTLLKNIDHMDPIEMKSMARKYLGMRWWTLNKRTQNEYKLLSWIKRQISLEYYTPHSWRSVLKKGSREERTDDLLEYIFQLQALRDGIMPTLRKSGVFKKNKFLDKINQFYSDRKVKLATIFLLNQNLLFGNPKGYFLSIEMIDLSQKEIDMIFHKPSLESFQMIKKKYKKALNINVEYNRYRRFTNNLIAFYVGYTIYKVVSEEDLSMEDELKGVRDGSIPVVDGDLVLDVPDDLMDFKAGRGALDRWVKEHYPDGATDEQLKANPDYLEKRYLYLGIDFKD
jgi:hypothetical protein